MTLLPGMEPLPPGETERQRGRDMRVVLVVIVVLGMALGLLATLDPTWARAL